MKRNQVFQFFSDFFFQPWTKEAFDRVTPIERELCQRKWMDRQKRKTYACRNLTRDRKTEYKDRGMQKPHDRQKGRR
jgi:hypothetical protein